MHFDFYIKIVLLHIVAERDVVNHFPLWICTVSVVLCANQMSKDGGKLIHLDCILALLPTFL